MEVSFQGIKKRPEGLYLSAICARSLGWRTNSGPFRFEHSARFLGALIHYQAGLGLSRVFRSKFAGLALITFFTESNVNVKHT